MSKPLKRKLKKNMKKPTNLNNIEILIVEDEANMRQTLNDILSEENYKITDVGTIARAKDELKKRFYNIVLVDLKLTDGTGLELLKEIKRAYKETMAIVVTGYASLASSISALNEGAFAYLQKPLNMDEARLVIKKALKMQELSVNNRNLLNRLEELSLKDAHTGLYNYRYLIERLTAEFKRARRHTMPLSVILIDIDYFKSINDVYGHQYGDMILKEFAQYLEDFVRGNDVIARYGGEEFVIILPDINKKDAIKFGQRLLETIEKHHFDPQGNKIKLKISIGISSFPEDGSDVGTTAGSLNSADKALYNAKEKGGNRLCFLKDLSKDIKNSVKKSGKEDLTELRKKLSRMATRANQSLLEAIYALTKTIEAKDYDTSEHAENMVSIVSAIAKRLNLSPGMTEELKRASVLHDLGKIGIPDNILHKRKSLTKKEYEIVKKHPQIGAEIIRSIHFLKELVTIILYHHERFDGLGYSSGLKNKEIPVGARIIAIADVYQALISDRPYRKAYSKKAALEIIAKGSGTQFDPEIVKAFMATVKSKR